MRKLVILVILALLLGSLLYGGKVRAKLPAGMDSNKSAYELEQVIGKLLTIN